MFKSLLFIKYFGKFKAFLQALCISCHKFQKIAIITLIFSVFLFHFCLFSSTLRSY